MKIQIDEEDRQWYLQHFKEQCELGQKLLEEKKWSELLRLLLGLAGSGSSFKFDALSQAAEKARHAAEEENATKVASALQGMKQALALQLSTNGNSNRCENSTLEEGHDTTEPS